MKWIIRNGVLPVSRLHVGKWISLLYRYGYIFISEQLDPYNIGKGQYLFLLALYEKDGMSQEELSSHLSIDKGTTARALNKLEKAGYVMKKQNESDLRSNRVFLTDKAVQLKPHIYAIIEKWSSILSSGMTEAEVDKAFKLLMKFAHNAMDYVRKDRKEKSLQ